MALYRYAHLLILSLGACIALFSSFPDTFGYSLITDSIIPHTSHEGSTVCHVILLFCILFQCFMIYSLVSV